jgi:LemA protein
LENVVKARNQAMGAVTPQEKAQAENQLTQTLRSLFAVAEQYPDLKASQNMSALQAELAATENRVSTARQQYNDQAMRLNTSIETVPTSIVAKLAGFEKAAFFGLDDPAHRDAPAVKF